MHKNRYWIVLICAVFLATAWFSGKALLKLLDYSRLTEKSMVSHIAWKYVSPSNDSFIPVATYSFSYKGKVYENQFTLLFLPYKNSWAVEKDYPELTKTHQTVWFDPLNPTHSTLQKKFPIKESISALIMCCLLIYFICLGIYVSRREKIR